MTGLNIRNFRGLGVVLILTFSKARLKFNTPAEGQAGWRSSVVEQVICNHQVGGSNPSASSRSSRDVP